MNGKIYIVYEGDAWLSSSSMTEKGVFDTKDEAINGILDNHQIPVSEFLEDFTSGEILEMTNEEKREIAKQAIREQLENIGQTQGYSLNYHIQEYEINKWED